MPTTAPVRLSAAMSALTAFALLGGCTTALAPVDVTRFHTAEVPRGDSVAIAAAPGVDATGIEFRTYGNAVATALTRQGYTVLDWGKPAALTAQVDFDTAIDRPLDPRAGRSPVSVGVGGATGSYGSGLGLGVGINLSGPPKAIISTRLSVRLKRSATNEAVWEGRAETHAREGTPGAQPGIAAGKLADALFGGYPGRSGETISVK